jgi:RHS repeat-associated protein
VSGNRFVTCYAYHHGYFDGEEREFRGFGMVEQRDTEEFAALSTGGALPEATNSDPASHVPPVLTRTWFHTGAYLGERVISRQLEHEYYRESDSSLGVSGLTDAQFDELLLDDTVLPPDLSPAEVAEACRALKGSVLRQEVYGKDDTEAADRPYRVSERNYTVRRIQPRGANRHAVFFVHTREAIELQYERKLYKIGQALRADPRVSHDLTLEVDDYGNVLLAAAVAYGRRFNDADLGLGDRERQKKPYVTFSINAATYPVVDADAYRTPLVCESRQFELVNVDPPTAVTGVTNLFRFDKLAERIADASDGHHDLPYEDFVGAGAAGTAAFRRLLEHTRTLYRRNDLTGLLPLTQFQSQALPGESYTLAITPGLVNDVFVKGGTATTAELTQLLESQTAGAYVHSDGDAGWWIPSGRVFYSDGAAGTELAAARAGFFMPSRFEDPFGNASTVAYDDYHLLPTLTTDPLQNTIAAEHDYRVLQPRLVTDANGNQSAVLFDALGLVVATAVMGRLSEGDTLADVAADISQKMLLEHIEHPLVSPHLVLNGATTRLLYDLFAYRRTMKDPQPQPATVYMLARELHGATSTPIQHAFSFSDGFGREIQKKVQAEIGPVVDGGPTVSPRWVGSGWTIYNNKGKPVRQYEPFFSATHRFEAAHVNGVSPVLLYDPLQRAMGTLHPDRSWEKVVFDPWRQETWDRNDTALISNLQMDDDVGPYFARLPSSDYTPTWYASRASGTVDEQDAAKKVVAHAATQAVTYFDPLGRAFLAVADNGAAGRYTTRTEFDIEGNCRAIVDALGRAVIRYDYAVSGVTLHSASMESGARWVLHDIAGQPIATWDSRGHRLQYTYDELRRAVEVHLRDGSGSARLVQRTVYGEAIGNAFNHRTRVYQVFDGAGVLTNHEYDFKGNLLRTSRRCATQYRSVLDWTASVPLQAPLESSTKFDALNRPTLLTAPDQSVIEPTYNEANLLERLTVRLLGADAATTFVEDIDYNARGQRSSIVYGNGTATSYEYDPATFRLTRLLTMRGSEALQDLRYTYDPLGNITAIRDAAQQTIYFSNAVVSPDSAYTYDAVYRLTDAAGREHIGQLTVPQTTWNDEYRVHLPHPNDGQMLRRYTEHFDYDAVGNLLALVHSASGGGWNRTFSYAQPSQLEAGKMSNCLSATLVGGTSEGQYMYDAHGNMTRMSHLPLMQWDYLDRLSASSQQVTSGTPETTYYVYSSAGARTRKVTERAAAAGAEPTRKSERIYVGGFEVYREYGADGSIALQRESLHIMDDETRVAIVDTRVAGSDDAPAQSIRYQLGNQLGSAILELDDQQQIISYEEFYPYGSTSYQAGRTLAEVRLKRYRYTGKERDEETGLNYHGARYYAPSLARWVSCDPAGIADGLNKYEFVRSNPLVGRDRTGLQTDQWQAFQFEDSEGEPVTLTIRKGAPFAPPADAKEVPAEPVLRTLPAKAQELAGVAPLPKTSEPPYQEPPDLGEVLASFLLTSAFDLAALPWMGNPEGAAGLGETRQQLRLWIYSDPEAARQGEGIEQGIALASLAFGAASLTLKVPGLLSRLGTGARLAEGALTETATAMLEGRTEQAAASGFETVTNESRPLQLVDPRGTEYGVLARDAKEYEANARALLGSGETEPTAYVSQSGDLHYMDVRLRAGSGPGEAKYIDRWGGHPYHPKTTYGRAIDMKTHAVRQAEAYSTSFGTTLYVSNSTEFIQDYRQLFQQEGWENIRFLLLPARHY